MATKCDGCSRPARPGLTLCQVCADKSKARYRRAKELRVPRRMIERGDVEEQRAQAEREDAAALQWLIERGHRAAGGR